MGREEAGIAESCPACGGPVECGMTNEDETCWCFALPLALPAPPEGSGARCYCPRCLHVKLMRASKNEDVRQRSANVIWTAPMAGRIR